MGNITAFLTSQTGQPENLRSTGSVFLCTFAKTVLLLKSFHLHLHSDHSAVYMLVEYNKDGHKVAVWMGYVFMYVYMYILTQRHSNVYMLARYKKGCNNVPVWMGYVFIYVYMYILTL